MYLIDMARGRKVQIAVLILSVDFSRLREQVKNALEGGVGWVYPVRNDAPLLCSDVGSQNNSGGVWCPAGISNGVH
jgi:hypothetical protein